MLTSTDQLGNIITLATPPRRIVSLVPSQTEFLLDIGLDEELVGITRFCIHPKDMVAGKEKIGGTKQFNFDKIHALKPDLIIGNKEENYKDGIEELQSHYPVWMSDIYTLDDSLAMMQKLSVLLGKEAEGKALIERIATDFAGIETNTPSTLPSAAYFIWRKPYMVAASNTFINEMLHRFGVRNVFDGIERYPEIDPEQLATLKPDYIFLSSEPYSFRPMHIEEFQSYCPTAKVLLVDGEMFSWYGSRLQYAPAYFKHLQQML
ncbi:MAG: ABC transporter substrate-binding protein [Bacteroidetes bacterium]|nr:ABC transporter substrate-binding protein [Bacteroidota bacterium]